MQFRLHLSLATLALALCACGGTTGTVTTPTSSNTTAASVAGADAVTTLVAGNSSGIATSESVAKGVAKALQAAATSKALGLSKVTTVTPLNESSTDNCSTSGTVGVAITGNITIDVDAQTQAVNSIAFDTTTAMTFTACVETATITAANNQSCTIGTTLDGALSCPMTGSFTNSTADMDFACTTSATCSGLTVTVGGTAHTVGVNMAFTVAGSLSSLSADDAGITGTICVDNTTYNIADLRNTADDLSTTELGCN